MKRFILLIAAAILALPLAAQTTVSSQYVTIQMSPNHADWVYKVGETVTFDVAVMKDSFAQLSQEVSYTWGEEFLEPDLAASLNTGKSGHKTLKLKGLDHPGFMSLEASVVVDDIKYTNFINVAFEPEKIESVVKMPKDFKAFWDEALRYARKTPLAPVMTLMPEQCTSTTDVYHIRFDNTKGNYIYGVLSVPKEEGVYPAVLTVPGAGVRPYRGSESYPKQGVVSLSVGIHGFPVNMYDNESFYSILRAGALNGYQYFNNDNRDKYYYKRVITGMVKAADFLASLPNVDAERIGVYGGSQGGMLSMAVGALSDKIKAVVVYYPALSNISGFARGSIGGWPKTFRDPNETNLETKLSVSEYYDGVNFARLLTKPVHFSMGYNDRSVPPTTSYTAYNAITAPKELHITNVTGHWLFPLSRNMQSEWLIEQLTK